MEELTLRGQLPRLGSSGNNLDRGYFAKCTSGCRIQGSALKAEDEYFDTRKTPTPRAERGTSGLEVLMFGCSCLNSGHK